MKLREKLRADVRPHAEKFVDELVELLVTHHGSRIEGALAAARAHLEAATASNRKQRKSGDRRPSRPRRGKAKVPTEKLRRGAGGRNPTGSKAAALDAVRSSTTIHNVMPDNPGEAVDGPRADVGAANNTTRGARDSAAVTPRPKRCSKCGDLGHNARTCTAEQRAADERELVESDERVVVVPPPLHRPCRSFRSYRGGRTGAARRFRSGRAVSFEPTFTMEM